MCIPLDRGEVHDLSVSRDKSDSAGIDAHDQCFPLNERRACSNTVVT
jgi:hypothetical protein